jgi:hypothetical protein
MEGSIRTWFGQVGCDLSVARSSEKGYVAWALSVRSDGQLMPLSDKQGHLLLLRRETAPAAMQALRERMAVVFGAERDPAPDTDRLPRHAKAI